MKETAPLALTLGEPAGIGPEITAKAWMQRREAGLAPFFLIGARSAIAAHGTEVACAEIAAPEEAPAVFEEALPILERPLGAVALGRPSQVTAAAVIGAIDDAVALALEGRAGAVVTNPIQKKALYDAGFSDPGHTEYLARRCGLDPAHTVMMLAVEGLRVVPLTVHVPLARVPALVTAERLAHVARVLNQALIAQFAIAAPRIAVAGLNPHAGEDGSIGREDLEVIAPALEALRCEGLDLRGPLPADTLFHARARQGYDAALCMYHDQALVPLKTIDFDRGVNITLGLPIVRTSPDHGTALDIAGRGLASPDSLIAAIRMAGDLAARRGAHD